MKSISSRFQASLALRALDNALCWRALATLVGGFVTAFIVVSVFGYISLRFAISGSMQSAQFSLFLGALCSVLLGLTSLSAAGFLLNDRARGRPDSSFARALTAAGTSLPRLLCTLLLFLLSGVALAVAIMALLAFCKIPVIGPALYTVIFPISIVGFAVLSYAFVFVGIFALPAIWNGYSVMETLRRLVGIIRRDLVTVIIQQILLGLLVLLSVSLISAGIGAGTFVTGSLSTMILGMQPEELMNSAMVLMGMGMGTGASGYMNAAAVGGGILYSITAAVPVLIMLSGIIIIFNAITANDPPRSAASRPFVPAPEIAIPPDSDRNCPRCLAAVGPLDSFCGECGHNLHHAT